MNDHDSNSWRPNLPGWSTDILRFYDALAAELKDGAVCVELGVFCGRSLAFLHEKLAGRGCSLTGVDSWKQGYPWSPYGATPPAQGGFFGACLREMQIHAADMLADTRIVRWDTADAASLFADSTIDFLFVDAGHDYGEALADLLAWVPKVKAGGIIAGHDYSAGQFPGVVQAVHEVFGEHNVYVPQEHSSVWRVRKW